MLSGEGKRNAYTGVTGLSVLYETGGEQRHQRAWHGLMEVMQLAAHTVAAATPHHRMHLRRTHRDTRDMLLRNFATWRILVSPLIVAHAAGCGTARDSKSQQPTSARSISANRH